MLCSLRDPVNFSCVLVRLHRLQCLVLQSYLVPHLLTPAAQVPTCSGPELPARVLSACLHCVPVPVVRATPAREVAPGEPRDAPSMIGALGARGPDEFSSGWKITSATTAPKRRLDPSPNTYHDTLLSLACFLRGEQQEWRFAFGAVCPWEKNTERQNKYRPRSPAMGAVPDEFLSFRSPQSLVFGPVILFQSPGLCFSQCSIAPSLPRPSPSPD